MYDFNYITHVNETILNKFIKKFRYIVIKDMVTLFVSLTNAIISLSLSLIKLI